MREKSGYNRLGKNLFRSGWGVGVAKQLGRGWINLLRKGGVKNSWEMGG